MPIDTSTSKAARAAAERSALTLIRQRTAVIGDAAAARHERDRLADELDKANARYADAYAAARAANWSADELAQLDLPAPEQDGRRRRSAGAATRPVPAQPRDAPAGSAGTATGVDDVPGAADALA
jgi:hypothetical protein